LQGSVPDSAAPQEPEPNSRRQRDPASLAAGFLKHPLLILLVGASISALFVPVFTRRWQDHQRALDIQTSLVEQMAAASETFLVSVDENAFQMTDDTVDPRREKRAAAALRASTRAWKIKEEVIATRLSAYYRNSSLAIDWHFFAEEAETLAGLADPDPLMYRESLRRALDNGYFKDVPNEEGLDSNEGYADAASMVRQDRDALIGRVLTTTPNV
jgi:hypothetical protein